MVTWLHVSCAVATPVALVVVIAGHSRTRSGGQVILGPLMSRTVIICTQLVLVSAGQSSTRSGGQAIVGFVVSRTVIFWTQLIELVHWSEAVQVRRITL